MEDFSVCILTRNEEYGLERLLKSLKGVDDIIVLDTGSTDRTMEIAKAYGCTVIPTGDRFRYAPAPEHEQAWLEKFGWQPTFEVGKGYFHFADARNFAASFAKHDWVFCPDADEEVHWDLDKIRETLPNEDHLTYRFIYAHNPDGSPALEFTQCKFFRKSKFQWTKWVHEVEGPLPGEFPKPPYYVEFMEHHHWQNPATNRSNYLPGLELSVLKDFNDDRNVFYLGREYMWLGRYEEALFMLKRAVELQTWDVERGEAWRFIGRCYRALGKRQEAIEAYHKSMIDCSTRRDAFVDLATLYDDEGNLGLATVYYEAAMAIPFRTHGYLNDTSLYGAMIPDRLAFAYARMNNFAESKRWWLEALKYNPDARILSNAPYYYGKLPLVSIVVPTVRPEGYAKLLESLHKYNEYPNWEIIKVEGEGTAVEKFNRGVEQANGDFIVFLADDTEVCQGWLVQAYSCFKEHFDTKGLVILNDGYWGDHMAHHFLCSLNIKDELGGEIWHSGYFHVGVDNELEGRLKNKGLVAFAENAKFIHYHPNTPTRGFQNGNHDIHYEKINSHVEEDRRLLYRRQRELGFGPKVAVFATSNNNEAIIEEFVTENLKYVDAVYISDNCSTDRTVELARKAGAHVRNSGLIHTYDHYDEGETKQRALDFALTSGYEWMLYLDTDEQLEERAAEILPILINDLRFDSYGMQVPTFWLDREHYRVDGDFKFYVSHPYPLKLFRRTAGIRMTIPPKGQHSFPAVNGDVNTPFPFRHTDCELAVKHYSFPDRETALFKYNRYRLADSGSVMSINEKSYEHLHPDYQGVELMTFGKHYPVLEEIIQKGDLVFDIGANVGVWTRIFKELGANVVSVEPNPQVASFITNNTVIKAACTDTPDSFIDLCIPDKAAYDYYHTLSTILPSRAHGEYYKRVFSENNTVRVPTVTLDSLIAQFGMPKHIKIDVEGAEPIVLRGLSHQIQSMSFEIIGMQPDWRECFELVDKLGNYQFNITSGLDNGPEDWTYLTNWGSKDDIINYFLSVAGPTSYYNVYCRKMG